MKIFSGSDQILVCERGDRIGLKKYLGNRINGA